MDLKKQRLECKGGQLVSLKRLKFYNYKHNQLAMPQKSEESRVLVN